MIKFTTQDHLSIRIIRNLSIIVCIESLVSVFLLPANNSLGFVSGLLSFSTSFVFIKFIVQKILQVGSIRSGAGSSLILIFGKFVLPIGLVWYSVFRGFDLIFTFFGLVLGLVNVSVLLFKISESADKNH